MQLHIAAGTSNFTYTRSNTTKQVFRRTYRTILTQAEREKVKRHRDGQTISFTESNVNFMVQVTLFPSAVRLLFAKLSHEIFTESYIIGGEQPLSHAC